MKLLRIIIIALSLVAVAACIWITAGRDHEALVLILLRVRQNRLKKVKRLKAVPYEN